MTARTIQQQFEQSMTLIAWFRNNPGASLTRASRELSMSVPQIRHELRMLMMCGLPQSTDTGFLIDVNMGANSAYITQNLGLDRPINLSVMEAGVLLLSVEAVRSTLPTDRHAAVDSAAAKIRQLMHNHHQSEQADGEALSDSSAQAYAAYEPTRSSEEQHSGQEDSSTIELADLLSAAIAARTLVTCDYLSHRTDSITHRTVVPDHLGWVEGNLYLWAREVDQDLEQAAGARHKIFRLERMDHIELGDPGSAQAAGPRRVPRIDTDNPFNFDDDESWASLHLSPQARWMLEYYPMWHEVDEEGDREGDREDNGEEDREGEAGEPTGVGAPHDSGDSEADTGLYVAFPDTGVWIERFLLANADRIAVNSPPSLAERVRQRARQGLNAYSRSER